MNEDSKYIIIKTMGHEVPVMFSMLISHSDFARAYDTDYIVSAGMFDVYVKDGEIQCSAYGKSITLKLDSRPEDKDIILKALVRS